MVYKSNIQVKLRCLMDEAKSEEPMALNIINKLATSWNFFVVKITFWHQHQTAFFVMS